MGWSQSLRCMLTHYPEPGASLATRGVRGGGKLARQPEHRGDG